MVLVTILWKYGKIKEVVMSKQTAVEWLLERFNDGTLIPKSFEIAKELEQAQIEMGYENGFADGWDESRYNAKPRYTSSTNYYNQTYKKAADDK